MELITTNNNNNSAGNNSISPTEKRVIPPSIDFQHESDEAWYTVGLDIINKETLRVKYVGFPENHDEKYNAGDFNSMEEIEEFEHKFRVSAIQAQDSECWKLGKGMTVCASYNDQNDELKFYNAIIHSITTNQHTFNEGEEVCTCSFDILWVHGPMTGSRTLTSIEHILILQHGSALTHPSLASFLTMSRESVEFSSYRPKQRVKVEMTSLDSAEDYWLKVATILKNKMNKQGLKLRDKSIATKKPEDQSYFILIENLEKDLAPQVIEDYIYFCIAITSRAYVFPTLSFETFTRGVIVVDSKQKIQKLSDFLHHPAHLVTSSRGSPWVISKEKLDDATIRDVVYRSENQFKPLRKEELGSTLTLVSEGTKEFEKAKLLKELYLEFTEHQRRLHKRLALEMEKILLSSNQVE